MVTVEAVKAIHDMETGAIIQPGYRAEVTAEKADRWAARGLARIISRKYKTKEEKFNKPE